MIDVHRVELRWRRNFLVAFYFCLRIDHIWHVAVVGSELTITRLSWVCGAARVASLRVKVVLVHHPCSSFRCDLLILICHALMVLIFA